MEEFEKTYLKLCGWIAYVLRLSSSEEYVFVHNSKLGIIVNRHRIVYEEYNPPKINGPAWPADSIVSECDFGRIPIDMLHSMLKVSNDKQNN